MALDKTKLLHTNESDLMRLINSTNERVAKSEAAKVQAAGSPLKPSQKKQPDPKAKNKRITLYMTQDQYDTIKEYAYRKRVKINQFILDKVMNHLGQLPKLRDSFNETEEAAEPVDE